MLGVWKVAQGVDWKLPGSVVTGPTKMYMHKGKGINRYSVGIIQLFSQTFKFISIVYSQGFIEIIQGFTQGFQLMSIVSSQGFVQSVHLVYVLQVGCVAVQAMYIGYSLCLNGYTLPRSFHPHPRAPSSMLKIDCQIYDSKDLVPLAAM